MTMPSRSGVRWWSLSLSLSSASGMGAEGSLPEVHAPGLVRSTMRTDRGAFGADTYVGSGTGTGSQLAAAS